MILLALTGWLRNVSEPGLAATLFIPQNSAIDTFMAQQASETPATNPRPYTYPKQMHEQSVNTRSRRY